MKIYVIGETSCGCCQGTNIENYAVQRGHPARYDDDVGGLQLPWV